MKNITFILTIQYSKPKSKILQYHIFNRKYRMQHKLVLTHRSAHQDKQYCLDYNPKVHCSLSPRNVTPLLPGRSPQFIRFYYFSYQWINSSNVSVSKKKKPLLPLISIMFSYRLCNGIIARQGLVTKRPCKTSVTGTMQTFKNVSH